MPRYTQVGNAVPPLLAEALGEMLIGLLLVQTENKITDFAKGIDVSSEHSPNFREIADTNLRASL